VLTIAADVAAGRRTAAEVVRAGSSYAHSVVLRSADEVDGDVRMLLELAYDVAAD